MKLNMFNVIIGFYLSFYAVEGRTYSSLDKCKVCRGWWSGEGAKGVHKDKARPCDEGRATRSHDKEVATIECVWTRQWS